MARSLGQALREARLIAGKSQREVAAATGVSRAAVGQWENDSNAPAKENLIQAAAFLNVTVTELTGRRIALEGSAEPSNVLSRLDDPPRTGTLVKDVPVLGTAVGGESADFYWNGETVDLAKRPAGIMNARTVYAVYVAGDSMYPRFNEGDLVYVNPSRPPGIGDDVIVELYAREDLGERNGAGFIKRLVRRTPTTFVVAQFNPEKEIVFQRDEVKHVHRIVPWGELLGI